MTEFESRKELGQILGFDISRVMSYAQRYPEDFRGLKGYLTHGQTFIPEGDLDKYDEMVDLFESLDKSQQSTFIKCNNGLEKSKLILGRERDSGKLPPAFDKTLAAPHSDDNVMALLRMSETPGSCTSRFVRHLQVSYKRAIGTLKPDTIIKLTNGSTTRIVDNGININDILSIVFSDPDMTGRFPNIIRFFQISNFDYETIEVDDEGQGGDHMLIADKEYKTREVYRMTSTVQVLSKAVHNFLDFIAKGLPGNYTYDHLGFLIQTIDKGRNRKGNLISTDMSKYSDTLSRKLIMGIVELMGFPPDVVRELDILYSLPIKDSYSGRVFSGTEATYQGQYGDFPLITIANLYLQCCVRDMLGYHDYADMRYDNAAVGDDTCFYFPEGNPEEQMNTIIRVYGMAGVMINKTKTHILRDGVGFIDFVKRVVDSDGLRPYWIPNLLVTRARSDTGVREVYRHYGESGDMEECIQVLTSVCGWTRSEALALMNLHKINGGLRRDVITGKDINMYMARFIDINYSTQLSDNGSKRWLNLLRDHLHSQDLGLYDTPLIGYYDNYDTLEDGEAVSITAEEMEENIILNINNMSRIGFKLTELDISSWLGKTWDEVKEEDVLSDYMTSFRFKSDSNKIEDVYDNILHKEPVQLDRLQLYGSYIESVQDYIVSADRLETFHIITNKLHGKLSLEYYFGHAYVYTYIGRRKVRLYSVEYNSNYSLPTNDELLSFGLNTREIDILRRSIPSRNKCYSYWKDLL